MFVAYRLLSEGDAIFHLLSNLPLRSYLPHCTAIKRTVAASGNSSCWEIVDPGALQEL